MSDLPDAKPSKPSANRHKRRKRWATLLIIAVSFTGLARFSYLRVTRRPTPRPDYWQLQLETLDPSSPEAISEREALIALSQWPDFQSITALPSRGGRSRVPGRGSGQRNDLIEIQDALCGPWDKTRQDIIALTAHFNTQDFIDARTGLRDAVQAGWNSTPSLWAGYMSRYLAMTASDYGMLSLSETWLYTLIAHSRWAREQTADWDTAIQDWLITLRLLRQIERQQNLRPQHSSLCRPLLTLAQEMSCAARESDTSIPIAKLAADIDAIRNGPPPCRLIAETIRIRLHHSIEHWYVREGGDWLNICKTAQLYQSGLRGTAQAPSRIWNLASPVFCDLEEARHEIDDYCDKLSGMNTLPACRKEPMLGLNILHGYLWGVNGYPAQDIRDKLLEQVALDGALTMFALNEYRRRNGEYPDSLAQLVPDWLPKLPIDTGSQQPLRYRRMGDDYVLYSVGINGKDQNGRSKSRSLEDSTWTADIVFSNVRRKEKRP